MVEKVSATLSALREAEHIGDEDAAAAELALTYAAEIDRAAIVRGRADKAVRLAMKEYGDEAAVYEMLTALRAKLSERDTVDRIGRDLHALLNELGATPKARHATGRQKGRGGRQTQTTAGALARARAEARNGLKAV